MELERRKGKRTFYLRLEAHRLLLFVSDLQSRQQCMRTLVVESARCGAGGVIGKSGLEREGERRGLER